MEEALGIVIVLNENDVQNLKNTYQSINSDEKCNNIFVVCEKEISEECKDFCSENKMKIYTYKSVKNLITLIINNMKSKFVTFVNEGDLVSGSIEQRFNNYLNKNLDENIGVGLVRSQNSIYFFNRKMKKNSKIKIEKDYEKIWINKEGMFIKIDFINKVLDNFDENSTWEDFSIGLILLNGGYSYIDSIRIKTYRGLEDDVNPKEEYYDVNWYFYIFDVAQRLLKICNKNYGYMLRYVQYAIMYMVKLRFNANTNMKNKHIIIGKLLEQFYSKLKDLLELIDDEVIKNTLGNKNVNYYLLRMKYNKINEDNEYAEFYTELYAKNNKVLMFEASKIKIKILLMDYVNGELRITANYSFPFDEKKLKICAVYNKKTYYAKKNYLYSDYKVFGKTIYSNYTFDINVPLNELKNKEYIEFYLISDKAKIKLDLNFTKPLSRLNESIYSYWNIDKYSLNCRKGSILVLKRTVFRTLKRELKYIKFLLTSKDREMKKCAGIRIIYFLTKIFFKKKIWLFEDKIYKAGDNGEYLYNYSIKKKDGIKKYYILSSNSEDAGRFKKEGKKYIKYGSILHKLLLLNSDIVFETHNNLTVHHSFDEKNEKYFRDLFNSKNVCIQHGLTVQYIPHLTNRINDNLKQFFLASPIEYKNMLNKEYDYTEHKEILKITGSPRYDGLKNNDKKQILITPSWRNYIATPISNIDETRKYNKNFINSNYFKIYNSLINNFELIETAKKQGYKIIYLLHPCTSPQINDFDKNDYTELIAATDNLNYEKILTESSLMVTDYSGVQFDFAYMYKPILYYHPNDLPPSYDEGEYKYNTMALGEIIDNENELVKKLCEYMNNDCKIKEEYKNRIDNFFKYHDYNNCERIYKEIMNKFYNK